MAVFALQHGVRADQREAILVIANIFEGNLPAPDRVAAFAIGTELTTMNVCMAIGAVRAYVLEHQLGVAIRACHLLVHASQGVTGLVVVELRVGADWFPTRVGVAILACNRDWAVRVGDFGLRSAHLRIRIGPRLL